ncbi:hypothetical protein [Paenibacillus sp. FSL L8-0708]|uniref:hypothetical protein n=1 Tax=Paenibacillus sp. FSL L8-0708 TaxID=2975311 RepID=UPI0030FC6844
MKKFISGIIVGALLFAGTSVFADSVGLIGQKVQGLFTIEKSGVKVADAVIINGSAYAPVRAVADATGSELKVEGKKIIMSDSSNKTVDINGEEVNVSIRIKYLQDQIQTQKDSIKSKEDSIADIQGKITKIEKDIEASTSEGNKEIFRWNIDNYKKQITSIQAEIDAANAEIAALQAQVTALEK